jgi:protein SCO1/2
MTRLYRLFAVIIVLLALGGPVIHADDPLPQDLIKQVGFDQRLDAQLPLELPFTDSTGKAVTLGDYFRDKPVILVLGYYECPMLCSLVRNGLFESLKQLDFTVGQDFEVVIVSIDPGETPEIAEVKRKASMMQYGRSTSATGWNFLVGDEANIQQLAAAIGFKYTYDPKIDEYVHPSGIIVVTPQGKIARYFYGIDYPAQTLRFGLVEAAANKIGSPVDQFLLICYHYDPASGEYTLTIMNIVRMIGGLTVAVIGGAVLFMLWRDWRKPASPRPA